MAASVPAWLQQAPDTGPLSVNFTEEAEASLQACAPKLRFCPGGAEEARAAIVAGLCSELRSVYRRERGDAAKPYTVYFDSLDFKVDFDDAARSATVIGVRHAPQWPPGRDGLARGDARLFLDLLSPAGLRARVNDDGDALWRVNGVLLGVALGAAHAGSEARLRLDWRAATLRACVRREDGGWETEAAMQWRAEELMASQAKGYKRQQALGYLMTRGPLAGGAGPAWLPAGAKLGLTTLWEAIRVRRPLDAEDWEAWEREANGG